MARFLFTVWPFAGHLHPSIAIAHALRARGHEVAFYTGARGGSIASSEGFKLYPFVYVDEEKISDLASSKFPYNPTIAGQLRAAKQMQANFREWLLDTIPQQIADLDGVLADWRPDVVVCDQSLWGPILVLSEARGLLVAVLSVTAACILPGPDAPAWGRGWPRPTNAFRRMLSRLTRAGIKKVSSAFLADVNRMRKRYGLPPISCPVTEFAARMPLYLIPSTPEYDYNRTDLPPSARYVGPCLWDRPGNAAAPAWLNALPPDQPLIYVTEATIGTTEPFLLKTAVLALRDMPVQVVMTTGKQRDPRSLGIPESANVRVESYVPQSDLLPRTAAMVTLGGSGGVLAALQAGVPLVVVPTEWDRPENAQRVVEAGAGIRIERNRCTPENIRAAVERVLHEASFRQNAQRLAAAFSRFAGPQRAAELLEELSGKASRDVELGRSVSLAYGGRV